jgi:ABC-type multidrug transport system permease subunit
MNNQQELVDRISKQIVEHNTHQRYNTIKRIFEVLLVIALCAVVLTATALLSAVILNHVLIYNSQPNRARISCGEFYKASEDYFDRVNFNSALLSLSFTSLIGSIISMILFGYIVYYAEGMCRVNKKFEHCK